MYAVLIALFVSIIGVSPIFSMKHEWRNYTSILLFCVYFFITYLVSYFGFPSIAYPLTGCYFVLCMTWFIGTAVASLILREQARESSRSSYSKKWGGKDEVKTPKTPKTLQYFPVFIAGFSVILLIGTWVFGWAVWGSQDHKYASLIGEMDNKTKQHWSQDQQPIDPTHIRLVTYDLATSLAATSLSDSSGHTLGSQYTLDETHSTLQKIGTDYFYLIPVDFSSYWRWVNTESVNDYVKVSATDPSAKPILVNSSQKMKYTFGAFLWDNIERILYKKYYNYVLEDFTFEEDDNGKVWWTVTATQPTISWNAEVVKGVIIFDPETGNDTFVPKSEIDNNNPKYLWVDRVIPKKLVQYYINLWGDLKDGWGNAVWWGKKNNLLVSETPVMNYSIDGRCVYVTPVTSINSDQTMVGLIYTDARTGKSVLYTTEGGQTESSIIGTVETAIKNYPNWYASEQIVYENIYGELCALVPVLAKDQNQHANFQCLGIVSTKNKTFALGKTPKEALQLFVKTMMNSSGQLSTEATVNMISVKDVIWRLGVGENNTRYIQFKKMNRAIVLNTTNTIEIVLSKEGDSVEVKYINSNETALPSVYFRNITNHIEMSKNQENVQNQVNNRIGDQKKNMDTKDMKAVFDTMSTSEKMKLYEQMKKNR